MRLATFKGYNDKDVVVNADHVVFFKEHGDGKVMLHVGNPQTELLVNGTLLEVAGKLEGTA